MSDYRKTVHSTIEGVDWVEGVHYLLVGPFNKVEVLAIPPGVKVSYDRRGKRVPSNPLTIRYGEPVGQPIGSRQGVPA